MNKLLEKKNLALNVCSIAEHMSEEWSQSNRMDGETRKAAEFVPEVKVIIQSPNSFFIFSNHINSRTTASYSKYSTKLTAGNEIKH